MELELRLLILLIGLAIIALIYTWGIRRRIQEGLENRRRRKARGQYEPVIEGQTEPAAAPGVATPAVAMPLAAPSVLAKDSVAEPAVVSRSAEREAAPAAATPARPKEPPPLQPRANPAKVNDKVNVVLLVLATPQGQTFQGRQLLAAFRELELRYGDKGTWEYHVNGANGNANAKPVFGLGHLKEPGHFNMDNIERLTTPGLVLFMTLPGPLPAAAGVDLMVATANHLAQRLGGLVCNDQGKQMTPKLLDRLQLEANAFDRQLQRASG